MSKMKLLIGLPMYDGQLEGGTRESLRFVEAGLRQAEIDFATCNISQESLIPRGRNRIAAEVIRGDYTDLFFIDADLTFSWDSFRTVLFSKYRICGGTYPVKQFPITLNFNAFHKDKDKAGLQGKPMNQDNYFKFVQECADENGEIEVAHVPTGFLRIKTDVFNEIMEKDRDHNRIPAYQAMCSVTLQREVYRDFFQIGVVSAPGVVGNYLSEDWFFCEHARHLGIPVALQTKAVCGHIGKHEFNLGQHITIGQTPLIPAGKKR